MNFDFGILINDSMQNSTLDSPTVVDYRQKKICCFWDLNNNFKIDPAKFADYALVIENGSWARNNIFGECYEYLQRHSKNFIVLSYCVNDHLTYPNVFYFPYYGYWLLKFVKNLRRKITIGNTKQYLVSCLNGNARSHRVYNYLLLKDHKNFSNFYFTMHHDSEYEPVLWADPDYTGPHKSDNPPLPIEFIQKWQQSRLQFTDWQEEVLSHGQIHVGGDIYNPAYTDSYINLVTETVVDHHTFITEKTWKSIASGQLFLIIGYSGIISDLRKHGVDTFDDIINHNYYDTEPDWQLRIHKLHKVLNNLLEQDLEQLNQQTLERRKFNAEKFINGDFFQSYQSDIASYIIQSNQ